MCDVSLAPHPHPPTRRSVGKEDVKERKKRKERWKGRKGKRNKKIESWEME